MNSTLPVGEINAYLNFRQEATARVKLRCKKYLFVGLINIK